MLPRTGGRSAPSPWSPRAGRPTSSPSSAAWSTAARTARSFRRCSARCRWRASSPANGSTTTSRRTRASSRTRAAPSPRRSPPFRGGCSRGGGGGFFSPTRAGSHAFHTDEESARFGEPHDRRILEAVREHSRLTVLHCHGERLMFDRLAKLPADVWNWDDRRAGPSLAEGKTMVPGAVQGGLNQWSTLKDGTGPDAKAEAQDALAQTGGIGIILGAGCVLLTQHSDATMIELVQSLAGSVKLMGITPQ